MTLKREPYDHLANLLANCKMIFYYQLPLEIWLEIFHWVTISSTASPYAIAYEPFHTLNMVNAVDPALRVKSVLVLVCRQWRAIATELLYKDIVIGHGARALKRALEGPSEDEGYRRWVRRIIFFYLLCVQTQTPMSRFAVPYFPMKAP